jgi:hypothetical protein
MFIFDLCLTVLQLSGNKMLEENTVDSRYLEFDGTMEKI